MKKPAPKPKKKSLDSQEAPKESKGHKYKNGRTYHRQLRSSLNIMALVAVDMIERIAPNAKQRLLDLDERQNLSLAKDILIGVRRVQLDQRKIKASETLDASAQESLEALPKLTEDLKRMALRVVAGQDVVKKIEDREYQQRVR